MVNQIRKLLIMKPWERKTTYSDELDLEESDFETSLFPLQCYGNFKKSKKIIGGWVKKELDAIYRFHGGVFASQSLPVRSGGRSSFRLLWRR
jgi:hypothetical protein